MLFEIVNNCKFIKVKKQIQFKMGAETQLLARMGFNHSKLFIHVVIQYVTKF